MLVQFHCISRRLPFWSLSVEFIEFNGLTSVRRWCGSDVFINKLRAAILHRSFVVSGMFIEDPAVPPPQTLISLDAQNASVQFLLKWPTTNSLSQF